MPYIVVFNLKVKNHYHKPDRKIRMTEPKDRSKIVLGIVRRAMTAWCLERDGNRNLMDGFGEYPHYPVNLTFSWLPWRRFGLWQCHAPGRTTFQRKPSFE